MGTVYYILINGKIAVYIAAAKGPVLIEYTPLFHIPSFHKGRRLWSMDNRGQCDLESEKKNHHIF